MRINERPIEDTISGELRAKLQALAEKTQRDNPTRHIYYESATVWLRVPEAGRDYGIYGAGIDGGIVTLWSNGGSVVWSPIADSGA
jgi:hypothetical protein